MFDDDQDFKKELKVGELLGVRTSYGRFKQRIESFPQRRYTIGKPTTFPKLVHGAWWFVHNAIAHPLIAVLPIEATFKFHDYTSDKINGKK